MTVEQSLEYALGHHPLLQARQHEVEAARARLITAGLLPNPRFVLNTGSPLDREGPTDLLGRLEFTILTGGKRRLREAAAEAGIQRTRLALDRETEQVLAEAADAAVEVLYLQELAEVAVPAQRTGGQDGRARTATGSRPARSRMRLRSCRPWMRETSRWPGWAPRACWNWPG